MTSEFIEAVRKNSDISLLGGARERDGQTEGFARVTGPAESCTELANAAQRSEVVPRGNVRGVAEHGGHEMLSVDQAKVIGHSPGMAKAWRRRDTSDILHWSTLDLCAAFASSVQLSVP
jgi:hypothetical protein